MVYFLQYSLKDDLGGACSRNVENYEFAQDFGGKTCMFSLGRSSHRWVDNIKTGL
jgi:hypothetical protein